MNINIDELLQKDMTRTEFLGLIGAGVLSMIGITALLKNIGDLFGKTSKQPSALGYGSDSYGGSAPKKNSLGL